MNDKLPDKRAVEKALRECGLSSRQARKVIAGGWKLLLDENDALIDELGELKERFDKLLQHG